MWYKSTTGDPQILWTVFQRACWISPTLQLFKCLITYFINTNKYLLTQSHFHSSDLYERRILNFQKHLMDLILLLVLAILECEAGRAFSIPHFVPKYLGLITIRKKVEWGNHFYIYYIYYMCNISYKYVIVSKC